MLVSHYYQPYVSMAGY